MPESIHRNIVEILRDFDEWLHRQNKDTHSIDYQTKGAKAADRHSLQAQKLAEDVNVQADKFCQNLNEGNAQRKLAQMASIKAKKMIKRIQSAIDHDGRLSEKTKSVLGSLIKSLDLLVVAVGQYLMGAGVDKKKPAVFTPLSQQAREEQETQHQLAKQHGDATRRVQVHLNIPKGRSGRGT